MNTHKFLKACLAVGIVAMCAIGLVACQGGNNASGGTAATVNGTAISEDEVTNTVQNVRAQSGLEDQDSWGQFLASNSMTPESVRTQIIDSLVDQMLVKEGAAELDVKVDSSEVDSYVDSMKANFDSDDAWKKALSEAGFTEESYRESIESSLLTQAVGNHFEQAATPSDEDTLSSAKTYAQYYDGAKRSSHILFKVDDVNDEAAMTAAREQAQSVLDQINGGLDFAEAAKQYSADSSAEKGGDVGWDKMSSFVKAYQEALDGLSVGQVSGLVESEYGIHIIKCTDAFTMPGEITSLDQIPEDIRETVKEMAKSTKANSEYTAWLEGLREKADIVINDMPANVPYNVDMSKYQTSSSAEASDSAAGSEESASASSESASSSSSDASASAESSSSSESSASSSSASSGSSASSESSAS